MSEENPMCPNCVTPWKCNGPHELDPSETTATIGGLYRLLGERNALLDKWCDYAVLNESAQHKVYPNLRQETMDLLFALLCCCVVVLSCYHVVVLFV